MTTINEIQMDELRMKIQDLRDTLIEVQATAWAYKDAAHKIPDSVNKRLAEMEKKIQITLDKNHSWS
jgi:hypothetical protein